jgi:DNA polymerase-3 subunit delta
VKLAGAQAESFVRAPNLKLSAVLVYGPDTGLVRERAQSIAAESVPDLNDPFAVEELRGTEGNDAGRLSAAANAMSLGGGRRLVRLREAGDGAVAGLETYLEDPNPDCMLVIEAGDLGPRSALRKLFEGHSRAAAMACYVEDEAGVARFVSVELRAAGLSLDPEAEALLGRRLVGDRGLARSALAKLVAYMGNDKRVSVESVEAAIGDGADIGPDDAALACFSGDVAALDRYLSRLLAGKDAGPVAILRAAQRQARRLLQAQAAMESGKSADAAMASLRPPVFFKEKSAFSNQLRRWPSARLGRVLALLLQAEAQCKQTGLPDVALCSRALLATARLAGGRG